MFGLAYELRSLQPLFKSTEQAIISWMIERASTVMWTL